MDYQNPYNSNYNQQPQSEELGWDDEIKEENSFVLLPEGDYPFSVKKWTIVNKVDRRREKNQKSSSN